MRHEGSECRDYASVSRNQGLGWVQACWFLSFSIRVEGNPRRYLSATTTCPGGQDMHTRTLMGAGVTAGFCRIPDGCSLMICAEIKAR